MAQHPDQKKVNDERARIAKEQEEQKRVVVKKKKEELEEKVIQNKPLE